MITPASRNLVLTCAAATVVAITVLGVALFEPFGAYNLWVTLALSFGLAAWGIRRKLSGRDEVLSDAFKTSFAVCAPAAMVVSILFMAFAARFDPLGDYVTGFIEGAAKYSPALTGFAFGICFTGLALCLCVLLARALWWSARR
jgi:hypothetical protein